MAIYITQATEDRINKMVKADIEIGRALVWILKERKSWMGWYESIKKAKKLGIQFKNSFQADIGVMYHPIYRALDYRFQYDDLFSATICGDLHHVTCTDFNKLVKILYNEEMERRQ